MINIFYFFFNMNKDFTLFTFYCLRFLERIFIHFKEYISINVHYMNKDFDMYSKHHLNK